jgi:hypothetical protein
MLQISEVPRAHVCDTCEVISNRVRYDAVNAMLVNEFLKEHKRFEEQERKVQEQAATTTQLESTVAKQTK